ncbi:MAG: TolC family protein, partial [Bdellovibrionaceae bacterium]|nr:TolC family protein [Pseudobdellovibrionaceae bacterium]
LLCTLIATSSHALTLDEYLSEVQKKHKEFQSFEVSKEAAEDRRVAGDLALSPTLSMDTSYLSDEKKPQTTGGTKLQATQYNAGVAKQFSTGTYLGVSGNLQHLTIANPVLPGFPSDYTTGTLAVTLSQSLWKNAFGRAVSLRRERETVSSNLEKESFNLQQRQILYNAESAYWDYMYQQEELAQKVDSLERSRKIETWLKRRFSDGISDRADFLNAQALSISRELALAVTRDQALSAEKNLRDFMELAPNEKLPALNSDFKKPRNIGELISGATAGDIVRLDTYLASLEAQAKGLGAKEAQEALRPDLVLQGSYATNSFSTISQNDALKDIAKADAPTSQVALKFSYMFDTDAKNSQESLSRKEALAAQLKSERKILESASSWSELQRRYGELLKQIETAEKLNKVQLSRAKEQGLKLSRGRSVTSDVVISEEDASSSALSLNRMRAEARKIEAQSRLFIRISQKN